MLKLCCNLLFAAYGQIQHPFSNKSHHVTLKKQDRKNKEVKSVALL